MFLRHLFYKQKTRNFWHRNTILTRIGLLVCIGGLLLVSGYGNQKTAMGAIPKISFVKRVYRILPEEEYLKLQDDEIDIATGSLILAKRIYPDIDIQKYLNQIDAMAKELEPKLRTCKSPSEIVKTISRYLFVEQKLKANEEKFFINNVLDEKRGQCVSISSLYLSITERLQLPFYGVIAPDHMFVRYDDGSIRISIETMTGGDIRTDEQILEGIGVSSSLEIAQDGIYLKNLTKRQILSGFLTNRGNFYEKKREFNKAIVDFTKAIEINPKYSGAYYNRGNAFEKKGDFNRAIQDYTKAISVDPKDARVYYNRGNAYYRKREFDKAIEDFTKAIDLKPKYSGAYCNRGNAFEKKGDFNRAIQDYTKAISIDPKYLDAYYNRGIAFDKKGDIDKAIQDYTKAISIDPKNPEFYNNRGVAYGRKGDIDNQILDYTKAIDIDPKNPNTYFNRALSYGRKGDIDKALPDISQAISINSEVANYYFCRAIVYFDKGDKRNALKDLKKAIKLDPRIKNSVKEVFGQDKEYAEDEEFKKIIE